MVDIGSTTNNSMEDIEDMAKLTKEQKQKQELIEKVLMIYFKESKSIRTIYLETKDFVRYTYGLQNDKYLDLMESVEHSILVFDYHKLDKLRDYLISINQEDLFFPMACEI